MKMKKNRTGAPPTVSILQPVLVGNMDLRV
jgi:hypothetical protein